MINKLYWKRKKRKLPSKSKKQKMEKFDSSKIKSWQDLKNMIDISELAQVIKVKKDKIAGWEEIPDRYLTKIAKLYNVDPNILMEEE